MVHHRQRLPLRLEARDDLLGVHAQLDDLERDAPAHRLPLLGHVDHAAAAFADFLQQLVAADHCAERFLGWARRGDDHGFVRSEGARFFQEITAGFLVRLEKQFDALAQWRVIAAGCVEMRGALFRRQLQRGLKDGLFAVLGRVHEMEHYSFVSDNSGFADKYISGKPITVQTRCGRVLQVICASDRNTPGWWLRWSPRCSRR